MHFFSPIDALLVHQLRNIADILNISKKIEDDFLGAQIKEKLFEFYRDRKGPTHNVYQVAALWRDLISSLIENKKVKEDNKKRKQSILSSLKNLSTPTQLNNPDIIEDIVRDIFILFWEEVDNKDKRKFRDAIRKDLEKYKLRFTDSELDKMPRDLLLGTLGGISPLAIPIVSSIMLQQLTQGFMAWLLINVLGQKALQVAVLSSLSGPLGWGVAASALGIGTVFSAMSYLSYSQKQADLPFVQAILFIYLYRYQNRFNQRRRGDSA